MADIALVIGEALVDVVRRGGTETAFPGGSAANCAVALSRLDREIWFASAWGPDDHGELLARHLADNGISMAGDPSRLTHTASATATIGPDGAATYVFDITWDPAPAVLPDDATAVVVACGSIGAVLDPGADVVRAELAARRATALTYYDLNARPQVTGVDPELVARVEDLIGLAHLVKGSDEDLATLWPDASEELLARRVLERGAAALVVTKGADGATWWSAQGRVAVALVPVAVVDTIGAGDTFGAAVIDALWSLGAVGTGAGERVAALTSEQVDGVLAHAVAAAAINVSRPGADPPYSSELA
ncbi:MAG: PfkB family carbohydrate kinase [Nocardioides sp.]|nr:PfkB family carbohydrate kinase [Nocardioides sp.]